MSSSDYYRRQAESARNKITSLQTKKAGLVKKVASLQSAINSASNAAARASSATTIRSKMRQVEAKSKELASTERKIADVEKKIAAEQRKLSSAEQSGAKERSKDAKRQQEAAAKIARSQNSKIRNVGARLREHDLKHEYAMSEIEKLKQLPEEIVVLFLAANPLDLQQLRLDEEARSIAETIRKSKHRDVVKLQSGWAIRPADVLQAINEYEPTVVHFSGHGSDQDEIVFQDDQGAAKFVSKDAIVQMMTACSGSIRMVFFNACFSGDQALAVVDHVEAAIGMTDAIGDDAARVFASQFYSGIGFGYSLNKAFEQAKALLMMEGIPEENTPRLFTAKGLNPDEIVLVKPDSI